MTCFDYIVYYSHCKNLYGFECIVVSGTVNVLRDFLDIRMRRLLFLISGKFHKNFDKTTLTQVAYKCIHWHTNVYIGIVGIPTLEIVVRKWNVGYDALASDPFEVSSRCFRNFAKFNNFFNIATVKYLLKVNSLIASDATNKVYKGKRERDEINDECLKFFEQIGKQLICRLKCFSLLSCDDLTFPSNPSFEWSIN